MLRAICFESRTLVNLKTLSNAAYQSTTSRQTKFSDSFLRLSSLKDVRPQWCGDRCRGVPDQVCLTILFSCSRSLPEYTRPSHQQLIPDRWY